MHDDAVFRRSDLPPITMTAEEQRRLLAAAERAEVYFRNQLAGNGYNATHADIFIGRELAELLDGLRAKVEMTVRR